MAKTPIPTPNNLGKFLIKLSEDSELKNSFKKDPKGVMAAQHLSPEETNAVLTGNSRVLTAALSKAAGIIKIPGKIGPGGIGNNPGGDNVVTVVVVVVVVV